MVPPNDCSLTLYNVEIFLGFRSLPIRTTSKKDRSQYATASGDRSIGVRANIHLGGQTQFCPNGHEQMFVICPNKCNICPNWGVNCPPLTPRPVRLWIVANIADRSVAHSPISNRSYDQEIVRSGVTVIAADRPSKVCYSHQTDSTFALLMARPPKGHIHK